MGFFTDCRHECCGSMASMLTRFEVNGFKNLHNLSVDLGPYTCIAGPNAIGKSNLFDAIRFLACSATMSFNDAAKSVRSNQGDVRDIFSSDTSITFGAELLVNPEFDDPFGKHLTAEFTYLRYELEVVLHEVPISEDRSISTIVLKSEKLTHKTKDQARKNLGWASKRFIDSTVKAKKSKEFIVTREDDDDRRVEVYSGKRPSTVPLTNESPSRTAVSVYGQQDQYPVVMALRRELESWMHLCLEPTAMRAPSEALAAPYITENGGNIPRTLDRLIGEENEWDVLQELVDVTSDLVDINEIDVDFDQGRQLFTLKAKVADAPEVPARSLSDGTLRFLTLGVLLLDKKNNRLICFEEPENGIHPLKIGAMYALLHDLSADPNKAVGPDNPLRQVIVNTHSPAYMYDHRANFDELLIGAKKMTTGALTLTPVVKKDSWRNNRVKISPGNLDEVLVEAFSEKILGATSEGTR